MKSTIILIHGTWPDRLEGWWCEGSEFLKILRSHLERETDELRIRPISWSGENSARDRLQASKVLFKVVLEEIRLGRNVHLIAHSHGGNVILEMLIDSFKYANRQTLLRDHLLSWTTLGTPFFTYKGRFRTFKTISGLIFSGIVILTIFTLTRYIFFGNAPYGLSGLLKMIIPLLLICLPLCGLLLAYYHQRARNSYIRKVVETYGHNHYGLYSRRDEIVLGLMKSVSTHININKSKMKAVAQEDYAYFIFTYAFTKMKDFLLSKRISRFFNTLIRKHTSGTDRLFMDVKEVHFEPLATMPNNFLREDIEQDLLDKISEENTLYVSQKRGDLNYHNLADAENPLNLLPSLIHTSYFEHEKIIASIARFIRSSEITS